MAVVHTDAASIVQSFKPTDARLSVITGILDAFHKFNILYCHWKSNEHLAASMLGLTDLDILFAGQSKVNVGMILNGYGFKKFASVKEKQYKDIEDFIGLDLASGKIIHVHAHFKLTLGESYLKGYQLNLERQILESRVFDPEFGIYRIAPSFELVLLYFRYALKIRNRDILKYYFKHNVSYNKNILAEYKWLKLRCTHEEIRILLASLFPSYFPIYNLLIREFGFKVLLDLSVLLHKQFKQQRLYPPLRAKLLRWYREIFIKVSRRVAKFSNQPIISQRINPQRGLIVALVGADGSGKSTVIQDLVTTFRKKIDVHHLYMGRGKSGTISWQRKILKRFKKSYSKNTRKPVKAQHQNFKSDAKRSFKSSLFRCVEALVVARERRRKLKRIQAAKKKGMLVICDRFPQNQLTGYNDGPVLTHLVNSPNFLFRFLAKKEAKVYRLAEDNPPDIVFKLIADAGLIAARKTSMASLEALELKIEGVRNLHFAGKCNVVTIDASSPLADVVLTVKTAIWTAWN